MFTMKAENSQGCETKIEVINDVYCEDTDQYYVQLRVGNTDLWLTKDQADNLSDALETKY